MLLAEKMAFEEFIAEYEATLELLQEDHTLLRFRGNYSISCKDDIAADLGSSKYRKKEMNPETKEK